MTCYIAAIMPKHKVGDHLLVKLSGGRVVEATVRAVVTKTDGIRFQVSFGNDTALIHLWQIVEESR
jgi:hypothetical protein